MRPKFWIQTRCTPVYNGLYYLLRGCQSRIASQQYRRLSRGSSLGLGRHYSSTWSVSNALFSVDLSYHCHLESSFSVCVSPSSKLNSTNRKIERERLRARSQQAEKMTPPCLLHATAPNHSRIVSNHVPIVTQRYYSTCPVSSNIQYRTSTRTLDYNSLLKVHRQ